MVFRTRLMFFISLTIGFVIFVCGDKEIIDDYQLADEICKKTGHYRSSLEPPYVCICDHGYVRHDGVCVPKQQAQDTESRGYDAIDDEIELIRNAIRQHNRQDSNEDFNVVPNVNGPDIKLDLKEDPPSSNAQESVGPAEPQQQAQDKVDKKETHDDTIISVNAVLLMAVVAACSIAGLVGLIVAGVCWYRLQRSVKASAEAEYPAYGVTGPTREKVGSPGDRKLAQSAQMYHYQHQKQQMLAMEKANGELNGNASDLDSEEENEEGDYTVYECPGLAPTGEMEVKNPLFNEDTPTATPSNGPNNNLSKEGGRM